MVDLSIVINDYKWENQNDCPNQTRLDITPATMVFVSLHPRIPNESLVEATPFNRYSGMAT